MSSGEFSEPRLIHSAGFIDLCLGKATEVSSTAFLSSGTDGDVWIWTDDALEDADYEPKSARGRTHHAIAWHGGSVYVGHTLTDARTGVEKSVVSEFTLDDFTASAPLASFSLDVTSLDISQDGKTLVAGAVDHVVKVIEIEGGNYSRLECEGQIMCVRIDPKRELFAVSTSDGTVRMYNLPVESGTAPTRTARISSRIPDIEPSQSRLEISWTPGGEYLFAVVMGGVKRFKRDSFEDPKSFIAPNAVSEMFSTCSVSQCGKYVASSSMNGSLCVWNVNDGTLLSFNNYVRNGEGKVITSMIWHPSIENTLFFVDSEEHICSLSKCTKEPNEVNDAPVSNRKKLVFDSDDETNQSADLGAIKRSYGFDEEGAHISEKSPVPEDKKSLPVKYEPISIYEPPRIPKPFASGSSPAHLSQRYLKWNQYGMVTSYSTAEENTIEIRWHDASIHSDIVIDNTVGNYSMADINNELLVLASQGDSDSPGELRVQCINSWDSGSKEWSVYMESQEFIQHIALGSNFIAVITSMRFMRMFSNAGTQIMLMSHPGPVLTVCAAGQKLTTVSMNGGFYFEDDKAQFNISANTYDIAASIWFKKPSISETVSISLAPNANLEWIAYSKGGMLCTMDSKYCVRALTANGIWMPIHNFSSTMKSVSDHVFMIGIVENPHTELRYVYCKGTNYPPVASKLVPLIANWMLPLCHQESEKSQLEAKLIQNELLRCAIEQGEGSSVANMQELCLSHTRDVMRLFALSCKTDRECRAAELAHCADGANIIQSMCNFAAKTRHPLLVEKVAEIGRSAPNMTAKKLVSNGSKRGNDSGETLAPKPVVRHLHSTKREVVEHVKETADNIGDANEDELSEKFGIPSLNSSLNEPSSSLAFLSATKTAPNPFKRKAVVEKESEENIFNSLASPSLTPFHTPLSDSNKKKPKREATSRQSLLTFSSQKSKAIEPSMGKTGFELWLNSVETELRSEHEGNDEEFMKMATKKFKKLNPEEKKKWNETARERTSPT